MRFHLHKWRDVRDTRVHLYQVMTCDKCKKVRRRVLTVGNGWQPVDKGWIETGEWTPPQPPTYRPMGGPRRSDLPRSK